MVTVNVMLILMAVMRFANALEHVDVCLNSSGNLTLAQEIEGPWKFTSENCSIKKSAILIHFKNIEEHCSSSKLHHVRIAGHNFCRLKTGSCVVLQNGWRICDNINKGFSQCTSKVWIFNKTSLPLVRIKKRNTPTSIKPMEITYHHVKCEDAREMKLISYKNMIKILNISLALAIFLIIFLLLILLRKRLTKLFTKNKAPSVDPEPHQTSSQEFVKNDHCNDAYAMASEQSNVDPIYEMAEVFPGAPMTIPS